MTRFWIAAVAAPLVVVLMYWVLLIPGADSMEVRFFVVFSALFGLIPFMVTHLGIVVWLAWTKESRFFVIARAGLLPTLIPAWIMLTSKNREMDEGFAILMLIAAAVTIVHTCLFWWMGVAGNPIFHKKPQA